MEAFFVIQFTQFKRAEPTGRVPERFQDICGREQQIERSVVQLRAAGLCHGAVG